MTETAGGNGPKPDQRLLRWGLALATLLALVALLTRAGGIPMPAAKEPDLTTLSVPGLHLVALPGVPAQTGPDMAHSKRWLWDAAAQPPGDSVELTMMVVHARHHSNFTLAAMTAGVPELALAGAHAQEMDAGPAKGTVVMLGRLNGAASLQTCLVLVQGGGAVADVASEPLVQAVEARRERDWRRRVYPLIGLEANVRWECLLVTIRSETGTHAQLTSLWQDLFVALSGR